MTEVQLSYDNLSVTINSKMKVSMLEHAFVLVFCDLPPGLASARRLQKTLAQIPAEDHIFSTGVLLAYTRWVGRHK